VEGASRSCSNGARDENSDGTLKLLDLETGVSNLVEKVRTLGFCPQGDVTRALLSYALRLMEAPGTLSRGDRTPTKVLEHIEDSAAVLELLPDLASAETIADIGSGNGLPGVVVALLVDGVRKGKPEKNDGSASEGADLHGVGHSGERDEDGENGQSSVGVDRRWRVAAGAPLPRVFLVERSRKRRAFMARICFELGVPAVVVSPSDACWNRPKMIRMTSSERHFVQRESIPVAHLLDEAEAVSAQENRLFSVVLVRAVAPLLRTPQIAAAHLEKDGTAVVWAGRPDRESRLACESACRAAGLVGKWTRPSHLASRGELLVMKFETPLRQ